MGRELTIRVTEDGADAERADALAGHLRRELLDLDVDDVTRAPGGPVPPDARAVDVAAVGALLVTLGAAATNLDQIVTVVRGWLSRGGPARTVRIELDGDVLELTGASAAQQNELAALFVRRHGAD